VRLDRGACTVTYGVATQVTIWLEFLARSGFVGRIMQSVRMHTDGNGVSWAIAKCSMCGEVHKYLTEIVLAGHVACNSCFHKMELDRELIATDERSASEQPHVP
jgi:hypothetical protein